MIGWARPQKVLRIVNGCGHAQDVVAHLKQMATGRSPPGEPLSQTYLKPEMSLPIVQTSGVLGPVPP